MLIQPPPTTGDPVATGALEPTTARILDTAIELVVDVGVDGLQLRDVGRRAQVSLATIYTHFPSRDELVIAAVERWMAAHAFRPFHPRKRDESIEDVLVRVFHHIFLPWVANPAMLTAFLQASLLPGGRRLAEQGLQLARSAGGPGTTGHDPALPAEVTAILSHLTHGLLRRFGAGAIDVGEIVRVYEVAVRRLLAHG